MEDGDRRGGQSDGMWKGQDPPFLVLKMKKQGPEPRNVVPSVAGKGKKNKFSLTENSRCPLTPWF